jgi:hypothetical protein
MIIQDAVRQLQSYNDPHVKELAILIGEIEHALKDKAISQTEYVDLMVDVERLRTVIGEAQDLALDQIIHNVIAELINLAEMMKL